MDANEELKKTLGGYVIQIIQLTALVQKQQERIKELEAAVAAKEAKNGELQRGTGGGRRTPVKRRVRKLAAH